VHADAEAPSRRDRESGAIALADPSRRCRGCSHPHPALPGPGCPQLQRPAATGRHWMSHSTRSSTLRGALRAHGTTRASRRGGRRKRSRSRRIVQSGLPGCVLPESPRPGSGDRKVRTGQQPSEDDFHAPKLQSRPLVRSALSLRPGMREPVIAPAALFHVVSMKKGPCQLPVGRSVVLLSRSGGGATLKSLWPPRWEDQAKLDCSLAGASPLGSVYAARRRVAPRGANLWLRVSMCQIACASRRAMSIWATLAPRCLPSRRLLRW